LPNIVEAERELSQRVAYCGGYAVDRVAGRWADLRHGEIPVHEAAFSKQPSGDSTIPESLGVCDRLVSQGIRGFNTSQQSVNERPSAHKRVRTLSRHVTQGCRLTGRRGYGLVQFAQVNVLERSSSTAEFVHTRLRVEWTQAQILSPRPDFMQVENGYATE
jgi:hypothetical protein